MSKEENRDDLDFTGKSNNLPPELRAIIKSIMVTIKKTKKVKVAKLSAKEIAEFGMLESRGKALAKELKRAANRLESENKTMWNKLREKYDLFDKDHLTYDDKDGILYEIVEDENERAEGHS